MQVINQVAYFTLLSLAVECEAELELSRDVLRTNALHAQRWRKAQQESRGGKNRLDGPSTIDDLKNKTARRCSRMTQKEKESSNA